MRISDWFRRVLFRSQPGQDRVRRLLGSPAASADRQPQRRGGTAMTAVAATTGTGWTERYDAVVAPVLPSYFPVVADHAEGSWIWDVDGTRYLDLSPGIAVTNTGSSDEHTSELQA